MSFRLEAEPLPEGIRRVVLEQIDGACAELSGETEDPLDVAIHEARKRFKRIRTVLRLVRGELGERVYARESEAYRAIGSGLAGLRDARVLLDTVEGLASPGVQRALVERAAATGGLATDAAAKAVADLATVRARVAAWPLRRDEFAALESGLVRVYRQGRRRCGAAYDQPSAERFHDWRKRVKDLWHTLQLLEPTWPALLTVLADQAHDLSDLLGDDHDLGVLVAVSETERLGTEQERQALARRAAARGEQLRADARLLGGRLYAEEPWDFADRLGGYWKAWRAQGVPS